MASIPTKMSRSFSFLTDISESDGQDRKGGSLGTGGLSNTNQTLQTRYDFDEDQHVQFLEGAAEKKIAVISLDFGSTHSGFSYALTSKREVHCEKKSNGLYKEPTCALFSSSGKLLAFGEEARSRYLKSLAASSMLTYATASIRDYSKDQLYFDYDKLKMRLYNSEERHSLMNLTARAASGKEVPLEKLVATILQSLKMDALETIKRKEGLEKLEAKDCLWVLTVPAIWLEVDKQFMRNAAVEARIISDFNSTDLILALEPECAAVRLYALKQLNLQAGNKVLTLDCGGGTVDYCAIEVSSSNNRFRFKQLLEPSGGNWGSTYIDDNFLNLMRKLIGKDEFHRATLVAAAQHDIHSNWEQLKQTLKSKHFEDSSKGVSFELKSILTETGQNLTTLVKKYNSVHRHQLKCRKSAFLGKTTKLVLTPEILRTIFDPVIRKIVAHTERLVKKPELNGLKHIILVGGFGQCDYLKSQLLNRVKFPNQSIIVPFESSSVVMKGAVEFGLQPSVIESRKCALTVGVRSFMPAAALKDPTPEDEKHKEFDKKRKIYVYKDVFAPLVLRGQEVQVNQEVFQTFQSSKGQAIKFDIYASRMTDIKYVTDERCLRLGKLIIPVDPKFGEKQKFKCALQVGYTELFATVLNETTGTSEKMRIEFNKTGENAVIVDHASPPEDN